MKKRNKVSSGAGITKERGIDTSRDNDELGKDYNALKQERQEASDNILQKVGSMHLRLLDNEEQYSQFLAHLIYYNKDNEHYTEDVLTALEDGLEKNYRYQKLDNALSPRFIKIEERSFEEKQKMKLNDTEGAYHVLFHFDDNTECPIHFKRKQDQLLYMLILLSSLKSGYSSEFLRRPVKDYYEDEDGNLMKEKYENACKKYEQVKSTVLSLMRMVYPDGEIKEDIIKSMDPEVYFTDIVQKMKGAVNKLLKNKGKQHEERWFMPYTINVDKKRVYQMHMEPVKILYPEDFKAILDELPMADDYVDMSSYVSEEMKKENNEALLKGAQDGDIECMNLLAYAYANGIGRIANLEKAFSLFKKTADLGNAEGLFNVGVYYGTGDVVSQDYKKSTQYLQKAAALGDTDALYQLGVYKMHGFGCDVNWKDALKYYRAAANNGCADAANELGYIYDRGEHGIRKDDKIAFEWFLKAAELNHTEAIKYVIRAYHDGIVEDEDGEKYLFWVKKGVELEIPEVYLQVGLFKYLDKEYDKAFELLSAASEKGKILANHILANMLIHGQGVEIDDDKAIKYLIDGANSGDETCVNLLKVVSPDRWKEISPNLEDVIDMQDTLKSLVGDMEPEANQKHFLDLVDYYREIFHEKYQEEINRQLSIHQPSTDSEGVSRRKILVRKSSLKKARYEIIITIANGQDKVLKLNPNSLVLLLLTIICSYKSGYTTLMTLDPSCRKVMAELVKLVLGRMTEHAAIDYVWKYMTNPIQGTDSYKTYSNFAKQSIVAAIGEYDDAIHFLFDNNETVGKHPLRSMNIAVNDIELPQELIRLAHQMPDGKSILYSLEDE